MSRKLLFRGKAIPVVLVLLFLTLNAFSFKGSGLSSPPFSQYIATAQQQVKHTVSARHKAHYYKNVNGKRVQSPTHYSTVTAGACAQCMDGSYSFSRNHRGTCSHHGGVKRWLN
ncbi:MAG TPA: DUF3761 domain-containing protein [Pedobacter sp.]